MCGLCYFEDQRHRHHEVFMMTTNMDGNKKKINKLRRRIQKSVSIKQIYDRIQLILRPNVEVSSLDSAAMVIQTNADESTRVESLHTMVATLEEVLRKVPLTSTYSSGDNGNEADLQNSIASDAQTQSQRKNDQNAVKGKTRNQSRYAPTVDTRANGLRCSAVTTTDDKQARMRWEYGRIHMYALADLPHQEDVMIQVKKENTHALTPTIYYLSFEGVFYRLTIININLLVFPTDNR